MALLKKIFPILIIFFLLIIIKANVSNILDFIQNGSALGSLEKKLVEEKKKNTYLRERLKLVRDDQFAAEEAQTKLGMLKSGEYFVIAPTATPLESQTFDFEQKPNWKRWWELFF